MLKTGTAGNINGSLDVSSAAAVLKVLRDCTITYLYKSIAAARISHTNAHGKSKKNIKHSLKDTPHDNTLVNGTLYQARFKLLFRKLNSCRFKLKRRQFLHYSPLFSYPATFFLLRFFLHRQFPDFFSVWKKKTHFTLSREDTHARARTRTRQNKIPSINPRTVPNRIDTWEPEEIHMKMERDKNDRGRWNKT